jgi:mRNA-degrading endonuclease YafQ of YafQ-DinJ toxin-antitoxin module
MFILNKTNGFVNKASKFKRQSDYNGKLLIKALFLLQNDPFYPGLKTHKVSSRLFGNTYSSRVTGDIRIIWKFDENKTLTLLLLDLGGHSGRNKVYG